MSNSSDYSKLPKIQIPGHFVSPVTIEGIKPLGHALLQVRTPEGKPDETDLSPEELENLFNHLSQKENLIQVPGENLRLLI